MRTGFNRLKGKVLMQKVRAEMMSDINVSNNDKNVLNAFYDASKFANMENYVSYSRRVMGHEAS